LVVDPEIKDPNWLAGFTAGEGCFLIDVYKAKTKIGFAVTLRFQLTQHSRDTQLMESLVGYLGCGAYYSKPDQDLGDFMVRKFLDVTSPPHFLRVNTKKEGGELRWGGKDYSILY